MAFVVQLLDIGIVPDLLAGNGAYALALQRNGPDYILCDQVAAGGLALYGQGGEIVLERSLLELRLGTQLHAHGLRLAVVVGGEPDYLRALYPRGDIVFLVAGNGSHRKTLGIIDRGLAFAVNYIVNRTAVTAVEHTDVDEVLAEESLVAHLGHDVLAVLAYDNYLGKVGALADELAVVVPLEAYAHEAFRQVGVKLGVVVHHARRSYGLEAREFRAAGKILAVLLLEPLKPVDGEPVDMLDVVLDHLHFFLYSLDLLLHSLHVELGDLAHGLVYQSVYILHHNLAAQRLLVGLHCGEGLFFLLLPAGLVLLQYLVDAVFEVNPFQRAVVPVALQLFHAYAQLLQQDVAGVEGAVLEYLVDRQELGLVVLDHASIRRQVAFAVGECIQGVYCLVGGHVAGQVDQNLHLVRGHVLYLLDLDLSLVLGLQDRFNQVLGILAEGNLGNGDGALVYLLYAGAHLHAAAALALHVLGAVGKTAGGEVGVKLVRLALQDGHGGVHQLVEVVRQDLGRKAHADAVGTLGEQEGEAHRKLRRLVVAAVVRLHGVRDLRVEENLLGELAEACLDVTGCRVRIAGEDVAPVTLAVDAEALLAEGDEGSEYGLVAVGVVLHGLADYVRHLGVGTVVHLAHHVQHAPLDRLQAVGDVGDGTVQDHVGCVIQVPVLEHAGELELVRVTLQKPRVFTAGFGVFRYFQIIVFDDFFGHNVLFIHILVLVAETA